MLGKGKWELIEYNITRDNDSASRIQAFVSFVIKTIPNENAPNGFKPKFVRTRVSDIREKEQPKTFRYEYWGGTLNKASIGVTPCNGAIGSLLMRCTDVRKASSQSSMAEMH